MLSIVINTPLSYIVQTNKFSMILQKALFEGHLILASTTLEKVEFCEFPLGNQSARSVWRRKAWKSAFIESIQRTDLERDPVHSRDYKITKSDWKWAKLRRELVRRRRAISSLEKEPLRQVQSRAIANTRAYAVYRHWCDIRIVSGSFLDTSQDRYRTRIPRQIISDSYGSPRPCPAARAAKDKVALAPVQFAIFANTWREGK